MPVRHNWTAPFLRLFFVFDDIKSKRISNRHSCDVYIRSECGSCPADVATAARPRTATHDYGRFYSCINTISFHGSRRFIFMGYCSATHGLLLLMTFVSFGKQYGTPSFWQSWTRNFVSYACSGQRQFSTVSFSGFGLWVRVRVLDSDNHNRFPNSNPNLNHTSNRNLTLTPILTPNSS